MMNQILSNLLEEWDKISENIEVELDDDINNLTIKRISDKCSEKYYQMTARSETKTSREDEKLCNKCGTYGQTSINCTERK